MHVKFHCANLKRIESLEDKIKV